MLEWIDLEVDSSLTLRVVASPAGIQEIRFGPKSPTGSKPSQGHPLLAEAARQLRAYFAGELTRFDLPLEPVGTEFQKRVWRQVEAIPYGETRSYAQIAFALGSAGAVRAVGAANGANPLPIVIPCHRVIGTSGKLVGYGGGLPLKRKLLELEGVRLGLFAAGESS
jgi:methylated-DNA-[protein]-cysteine S-methyltransferase